MRKRHGRKRALGIRAPTAPRQRGNQRWAVDFAFGTVSDSRRFRVFCGIDHFTRECLATIVDNSTIGVRVAGETDNIAQGRPGRKLETVGDSFCHEQTVGQCYPCNHIM